MNRADHFIAHAKCTYVVLKRTVFIKRAGELIKENEILHETEEQFIELVEVSAGSNTLYFQHFAWGIH